MENKKSKYYCFKEFNRNIFNLKIFYNDAIIVHIAIFILFDIFVIKTFIKYLFYNINTGNYTYHNFIILFVLVILLR
jgi:hypothetical protein